MTAPFAGLHVALATPFNSDYSIDLDAFRRLVRRCVDGGVDVLCVLGTTGEAPAIEADERDLLITAALEEAGSVPVTVGSGSNHTAHAAELTARAAELGAAGALVVTPYYNKPTPAGLVGHYTAIAKAAPGFPLIAYNVPGRTGLNLRPDVLQRLWQIDEVAAIKESAGDMAQLAHIRAELPDGRLLLSGDDNMALPSISLGAHGLVSVLANAFPAETAELVHAALAGDMATARAAHYRLLALMDALFVESSPVPLKAALAELGVCSDVVRLPLGPAEASTRALLHEALAGLEGDAR